MSETDTKIDTQLASLFDDVAATITPTPNFDAVVGGAGVIGTTPTAAGGGGRPFRRGLAVAAAAVVVLGGAAAAFQLDGEPAMVATDDMTAPTTIEATLVASPADVGPGRDGDESDAEPMTPAPVDRPMQDQPAEPTTNTKPPAEISRTAELGDGELGGDPVIQVVRGTAAPGELVTIETPFGDATVEAGAEGRWKTVLELHDVPPSTLVPIRVTFGDHDTVVELTVVTAAPAPTPTTAAPEPPTPEPTPEPKPEPIPAPKPIDFTAKLGAGYAEATPMKQVVHGTATAGTKVLVTSAYGHTTAVAGEGGGWEAHLKMYEVPAGTNVRITASASGFTNEYEFWITRPAGRPDAEPKPEPEPVTKPFAADLAATHVEGGFVKVLLHGTGAPGTAVRAAAEYGVAETVVGDAGKWELALKMSEVPAGTTFGIRVTNNGSDAVYEFSVTTPEAPAPTYEFTAKAAFVECDSTPPFNEYWGTATPGSTITISSPYGGTQVTAGETGKWEARVEFPEAPLGQVFEVSISSSKDGAGVGLAFKRVEPA